MLKNSAHRPSSKKPVSQMPPRKPWQKVLYGNRGYPDNYTDPVFLKDLQKNINVKSFEYWQAVIGATKLTHQLSIIVVFLLVFHNLNTHPAYIPAEQLLPIVCLISCFGYCLYVLANGPRTRPDGTKSYSNTIIDDSKTVVCVLVFGFILSPMLHTLTKSISTDTIYTITFFMFLLHIICFDYGLPAALVSNAISINAAMFGTICLASRLHSALDAFVFLLVSFILFAVYPNALHLFESKCNFTLSLTPVTVFVSLSCVALVILSPMLFSIYLMIMIFCGLIYPFIFCYAQRYKRNINGPWDEATLG